MTAGIVEGTINGDLIDASYDDDPEDEAPTDNADTIFGDPGNDTIFGLGGDDLINGAQDDDTLIGGAGADDLFGGTGTDTASYITSSGGVKVSLADGVGSFSDAEGDTLNLIEKLIGSELGDILEGDSSANTLEGRGSDDILEGGGGSDLLIGGDGSDWAAFVSFAVGVTASLLSGFSSSGAMSGIENLFGSDFADTLTGDDSANAIVGNDGADLLRGEFGDDILIGEAGNDTLEGGGGADRMSGGIGDDLYRVDPTDRIDENGGSGTDTVEAFQTFSLANTTIITGGDVENLTLLGSNNIDGTGNTLNNLIIGNSGANTLKGGGGADNLQGRDGDDTYFVQDLVDAFDETSGSGFDTVASTVSFSLPDTDLFGDIEALVLLETANIDGTGNGLANRIVGNLGANIIDGAANGDLMQGMAGNDTYVVDNAGDIVDESASGSGGIDSVRSTVSFSFVDGLHAKGALENLTLIGGADINGTGNGLANLISGNAGRNVLSGLGGGDTIFGLGGNDTINGGAGADIMRGGGGNDIYRVEAAGDRAIETAGQGIDRVVSLVSFKLGANVENLTLAGSANRKGTGNPLANTINGNVGANTLDGAAGNDAVKGGAGNDRILGSAGNDALAGGSGRDLLTGGLGRDILNGGAGADRFDFNAKAETLPGGGSRDIIKGFSHSQHDKIDLSTIDADTSANPGNDMFSFIGAGAFQGGGGELRFAGGIIQGDINGDRVADFEIKVAGAASLLAADFVL